MPRPRAADSARRAEPRGIGSARARDPLAREVKLLGALLGQVIVEQEGPELFELVESLRRVRHSPSRLRRSWRPRSRCGPRRKADRRAPGRGPRLHRLLPAHQPRRGEAPRPDASSPRAVGHPPRVDRRCGQPARPLRDESRRAARSPGAPSAATGAHRSPDRGAAADRARRAAAAVSAAGSVRRSAPDPAAGPRPAATPARGDHHPVADRAGPAPAADPARRGARGDGVLRRDPVPRHAAAVPGPRHRTPRPWSRATAAARASPLPGHSYAGARGSVPTGTAIRASPPTSPARRCASRPTTSSTATAT